MIAKHFADDGIIDSFTLKETIQPTMSGGIDFYKDGKKILGVDVGWHDITYGTKIVNLDIGQVTAFEVERMLADKLTAILSRKRFRRPKDLYDFYWITDYPFKPEVIVEYRKAYNSLNLSGIYKKSELRRIPFDTVMERLDTIAVAVRDYTNLVNWNSNKKCLED